MANSSLPRQRGCFSLDPRRLDKSSQIRHLLPREHGITLLLLCGSRVPIVTIVPDQNHCLHHLLCDVCGQESFIHLRRDAVKFCVLAGDPGNRFGDVLRSRPFTDAVDVDFVDFGRIGFPGEERASDIFSSVGNDVEERNVSLLRVKG